MAGAREETRDSTPTMWSSLRGAATAGLMARGISVIGSLATTPLAAATLSQRDFEGALILLAMTALAPLGDLGVGLALLTLYPRSSHSEREELVATAYRLSAVGGAIAAATGGVLAATGWGPRFLFNASEPRLATALAILALAIGLAVPANARLRLLAAMGRQVEPHVHFAMAYSVSYLTSVVLLVATPSLPIYVMSSALVPQLLMLLTTSVRLRPLSPTGGRTFSRRLAKPVMTTAFAISSQSVALVVAVQTDVPLAAWLVGPKAAAELALVNKVVAPFILATAMIFNPLWPAFAHELARGSQRRVTRTLSMSIAFGVGCALAFAALLFAVGAPAVRWLSAGRFDGSEAYWWAASLWCLAVGIQHPLAMLINAMGLRRTLVTTAVAMLAINLTGTMLLLPVVGGAGAILSSAVAYIVCFCVPYTIIARRRLPNRSQSREAQEG